MNDTTQEQQRPETPAHGLVQVDGKAATSIRWTRKVTEDGKSRYDVSYRLGQKQVGAAKGMSADDLDEAIGQRNTDRIHRTADARGSLSGEQLDYHVGKTQQQAKDRGDQAAKDAGEGEPTAGDIRQTPEAALLAKRMGISVDELQKRLAGDQAERDKSDRTNTNTMARERADEGETRDRTPTTPQEQARLDGIRQQSQSEVDKRFLHHKDRYYFKDNQNRLAIEDRGHKLVTPEKDERVAASMAQLAEAKGWNSIKVTGAPEFQRVVWLEANVRGIRVEGYKPKEADLAALKERREQQLRNSVEQAPEREIKRDGERGNSRANEPSRGEKGKPATKEARGGDLTEAQVKEMTRRKQQAEDYNLLRPDHQGRTMIPKGRVIEAVAGELATKKIKNPETRAKVMDKVRTGLDKMARGAEVPTVHTYDRNAPAKAREKDQPRTAPQVQRNTERTR